MKAPLHPREAERLAALQETGVLDSAESPLHAAIVRLSADLCGMPIAAISLVDVERQWFSAITGLTCRQTPRDVAFCAHTILSDDPLVVNDATADARFADNALVTDAPGIRFYAGIPLKTADDLPIGSLCVIDTRPREITPHQLESLRTLAGFVSAQLELSRRSSQLLSQQTFNQMLVENATDYAMITLDANGLVTSWNAGAERIKGYTLKEILGRHYREFFSPEDRAAGVADGILAEAARKGRVECRGWRVRKDGTRFHIHGSITAVYDGDGSCKSYIKVTRDDTAAFLTAMELEGRTRELAEANERMAKQAIALDEARRAAVDASRSKSEFLANMSHEIRTPMTAILGYADLLADPRGTEHSPADRIEYVDTIKRNGEHLLSIINDILDVSKIEAGKMTVEAVPTSPNEIVQDVLRLMGGKAQSKGITLQAVYETALPATITSDPVRLRQILVNLVGNALKFTEAGGVTLRVGFDGEGSGVLRFRVEDTGIGLKPEQAARLFEAFVQADASTTRKFGGTGLGLRISRSLAQMLGGDITIDSEYGRGSTFTAKVATGCVTRSAMVEPGHNLVAAPQPQAVPSAPCEDAPLKGLRIMLAEDGPDNVRLISFHLRKAGADVRTVENGRQAVEALTVDGTLEGALIDPPLIDVVLTDMQMPEMDGYTAARLLRDKGWTQPIVALTAHAMSGDREKCVEAGCDAYASKPIDRDQLIMVCRAVLESRGQLPRRVA